MQDNHLFEYAVIRVVPRVEREEFMNVGVVVFCKKQKFLQAVYTINSSRLLALCPKLNLDEVEAALRSFERIIEGKSDSGPIGKLDVPSRFRWLTATRSTIIQTSKVHVGFCKDLPEAVQHLYAQLVLCES